MSASDHPVVVQRVLAARACRIGPSDLPTLDRSSSRVRIPDWWYERFTEDWKDADPDIPELIEARERLGGDEAAG